MIEIIKSLFGKKKEEEYVPDPPGRTFNKVLTGRYFGCEDENAEECEVTKAKQGKIDQIKALELIPMFTRYTYKGTQDEEKQEAISVHVVFQKEVPSERQSMTHVTEISFIVNRADFEEFETMAGVSLKDDFRDLTDTGNGTAFKGKERRKKRRER